jgi:two-component system, LytTR family, response regulator
MIRTIIIDDEPSAINLLKMMLEKKVTGDFEFVCTSTNPQKAKDIFKQYKPDLVFLDIQMPNLSGIELMKSIEHPDFLVVFVTAFDTYAIEAFKLNAIDYILKPVDADDLERVVQKVKNLVLEKDNSLKTQFEKLEKLFNRNPGHIENKIGIAMADKISFVNIPDIVYCEANGPYTNLYLEQGKKLVASKPLGEFETQLQDHRFLRIHHSTLINLNRVKEFQRMDGGYVVMENGSKLEISQRKRKDFLDAIEEFMV